MPTGNSLKFVASTGQEIPCAELGRVTIRQSLGTDPAYVMLPFHSDYLSTIGAAETAKRAIDEGPVFGVLRFVSSDDTAAGSATKDWAGWFVVKVEQDRELSNVYYLMLADYRELLRNEKISGIFNLKYGDGTEISESKNAGNWWKVGDYVSQIITLWNAKFGASNTPQMVYGGGINMDTALLDNEVPKNLGNTVGVDGSTSGGWIAANFDEMMEPIMKAFGLSYMIGTDGKIYVTDTTYERADLAALIATVATKGSGYQLSDMSYSRPKNVTLVFEKLMEVAIETRPSGTLSPPTFGVYMDNVFRLPDDLIANDPNYNWTEIEPFADDAQWSAPGIPGRFKSRPENWMLENFFKVELGFNRYNLATGLVHAGGEKIDYLVPELVANWHATYKVDARRDFRWSNLRLGRLEIDGSTKAGGNVFGPWCYLRRKGVVEQGADFRHVLAHVRWHENFNDVTRPAAFFTYWTDPGHLILRIEPTQFNQIVIRGAVMGANVTNLGYGTFLELKDDAEDPSAPSTWAKSRARGSLEIPAGAVQTRIIMNGVPLDPTVREHAITKTAFGTQGTIGEQRLKIYGVTANFAYKQSAIQSYATILSLLPADSHELLNGTELDEIADRVTAEVMASYDQNKIGAIKAGGIALILTNQAGGECNEMWVEYGGETKFSLSTQWSIKPARIEITVSRKKLDGSPVKVAI